MNDQDDSARKPSEKKTIAERFLKALRSFRQLPIAAVGAATYFLSGFVPRNKNLWVFGSWFGENFADNPKYLFLYTRVSHPNVRSVWLSHNKGVRDELRARGHPAYCIYGLRGVFYSMRASCVVFSVGVSDVNRYAIKGAKLVELWHGTPLKKLAPIQSGNDAASKPQDSFPQRLLKDVIAQEHSYDIVTSASDESKRAMAPFFHNAKRVVVTGYPRNDILLDAPWLASYDNEWLRRLKQKIDFQFIFLYLPTHRDEGRGKIDLFAPYNFSSEAVDQALTDLDAVLIVKGHHYHQRLEVTSHHTPLQRVYSLSDAELPDPYPLLRNTDVLITDYSSVFFDYLLLDRPIIFAPFDLQEYTTTDRELLYNYDKVTPGPKAKDWPDVIRLLREVLEHDVWRAERKIVCRRFNKFRDSNNSQRVFEAISRLLEKSEV